MLTPMQKAFATSREPFPAFVGGFGSGKSAAAIARAMGLKTQFKHADIAYYLPTYPLVEDIAFRRFPELCERKGWAFKLNRSSSYIEFPNAGRIVFRTMENPDRIVGYEVAHSILDELDTLPVEKARHVWNKVIARNRQKIGNFPNTVAVATTPEGFKFVHEMWVKKAAPGYVMFKARTMDNAEHLPDGYIDNLTNTYPQALLSAYLDGEFCNLTAGTVYTSFNRITCFTNETIKEGEAVHIGMDFNVTKMAAVVHVLRNGRPMALDEFVNLFDTPAMIRAIQNKYQQRAIFIYPDASGGNRKSQNASASDIMLLQQAGFIVLNNPANPAVKDRVLAMNRAFEIEYKVNPDTCPYYVEGLEQQAYDNGEPDKKSGFDHCNDAGGYFVAYKFPIPSRAVMKIVIGGM